MKTCHNEAFKQGRFAGNIGKLRTLNPFGRGLEPKDANKLRERRHNAAEWLRGWTDGRAARLRQRENEAKARKRARNKIRKAA